MDVDEFLPRMPANLLAQLAKEDLDRLSVDELRVRILALEGEIERSRGKIEAAVNHRVTAEGLFRR